MTSKGIPTGSKHPKRLNMMQWHRYNLVLAPVWNLSQVQPGVNDARLE
jgi:hypothetical protein